ncbi:DUF6042 family protein [Shimazuella alba]|uniref:Uncharacterized protein n=1 Tax=Shimazuella alba TaxID=2690964 RepID=A0A6I4VYU6_9BACL|nr:DUF6042 family protein [Shimazuella alba]MXQ53654.1 hypothetical protein [Shimazuella alba]
MRIQTVLSTGWKQDYLQVPAVFFELGWNLYLPQGMNSVVLSVVTFIYQGYSKSEIFFYMEEEAKKLAMEPFPLDKIHKQELMSYHVHHELYLREQWCESILVRSSLRYPTTISDMVQLLIDIGILIEVNYREITYLDLILQPFPRPKESLVLTPEENDRAKQQIQLFRLQ